MTRGVEGTPGPETTMRYVFAVPWVHSKSNPAHPRWSLERSWFGMSEPNGPFCVHGFRRIHRSVAGMVVGTEDLGRLDWADWDHDGSLLYSEQGCLYRRPMATSRGRSDATSVALVADLRANVFTNVLPPDSARRWP